MNTIHVLLYTLLSLFVLQGAVFSQIQNPGFEDWSGNQPEGWFTSNAPPEYTNVSQSATAHSGMWAVEGVVINFFSVMIPPILQSGEDARGFPYDGRPAGFSGYYEFFPQGGDQFVVNAILYNGGVEGNAVAIATALFGTPSAAYTLFDIPFSYLSADTPDTCVIQFLIIGPTPGNTWHEGSSFILDDIAFSGTVSVDEIQPPLPSSTVLLQNYPNPFNPATTISFDLAASGRVHLGVFDLLGREVATLMDENLNPGYHAVVFDGSDLASGVYFYRLQTPSSVQTRRLILQK